MIEFGNPGPSIYSFLNYLSLKVRKIYAGMGRFLVQQLFRTISILGSCTGRWDYFPASSLSDRSFMTPSLKGTDQSHQPHSSQGIFAIDQLCYYCALLLSTSLKYVFPQFLASGDYPVSYDSRTYPFPMNGSDYLENSILDIRVQLCAIYGELLKNKNIQPKEGDRMYNIKNGFIAGYLGGSVG